MGSGAKMLRISVSSCRLPANLQDDTILVSTVAHSRTVVSCDTVLGWPCLSHVLRNKNVGRPLCMTRRLIHRTCVLMF
jgi:hypothetical protein